MMIKENNKIFPFRFKKYELIFPRLTSRTMAGRFVCEQAGDLEKEYVKRRTKKARAKL